MAISSTRTGIAASAGKAATEARSLLLGIVILLIPLLVSLVLLVWAHRISVSDLLGERMLSRGISEHMLTATIIPVWVVGLLLHSRRVLGVLCGSVGVAVGTHSEVVAAGEPLRYFLGEKSRVGSVYAPVEML